MAPPSTAERVNALEDRVTIVETKLDSLSITVNTQRLESQSAHRATQERLDKLIGKPLIEQVVDALTNPKLVTALASIGSIVAALGYGAGHLGTAAVPVPVPTIVVQPPAPAAPVEAPAAPAIDLGQPK